MRPPLALVILACATILGGCYLSPEERVQARHQHHIDRINAEIARHARGEPPKHYLTLEQTLYERELLEARMGAEIRREYEREAEERRREEEQRRCEEERARQQERAKKRAISDFLWAQKAAREAQQR